MCVAVLALFAKALGDDGHLLLELGHLALLPPTDERFNLVGALEVLVLLHALVVFSLDGLDDVGVAISQLQVARAT